MAGRRHAGLRQLRFGSLLHEHQLRDTGGYTGPGLRFDARYEHIFQDQRRLGGDKVEKRGDFPEGAHDVSRTTNRSLVLSLDWSFTPRFGVSVTLPLIDRRHFNEDFPRLPAGVAPQGARAAAVPGKVRAAGHLVGVFPEGHKQGLGLPRRGRPAGDRPLSARQQRRRYGRRPEPERAPADRAQRRPRRRRPGTGQERAARRRQRRPDRRSRLSAPGSPTS